MLRLHVRILIEVATFPVYVLSDVVMSTAHIVVIMSTICPQIDIHVLIFVMLVLKKERNYDCMYVLQCQLCRLIISKTYLSSLVIII